MDTDAVTYEIIETETKRNNPMLVDSYGFCYSRIIDKRYKGSKMKWKCTVRPSTASNSPRWDQLDYWDSHPQPSCTTWIRPVHKDCH